jgi:hypothetical protein
MGSGSWAPWRARVSKQGGLVTLARWPETMMAVEVVVEIKKLDFGVEI